MQCSADERSPNEVLKTVIHDQPYIVVLPERNSRTKLTLVIDNLVNLGNERRKDSNKIKIEKAKNDFSKIKNLVTQKKIHNKYYEKFIKCTSFVKAPPICG